MECKGKSCSLGKTLKVKTFMLRDGERIKVVNWGTKVSIEKQHKLPHDEKWTTEDGLVVRVEDVPQFARVLTEVL